MMDNGKDLDGPPGGPWVRLLGDARRLNHVFSPIIQFTPNIALKADDPPSTGGGLGSRSFKSASLLHTKLYSRYLNKTTMQSDVFYALYDLFAFAAFAENQFLGFVQSRLDIERRRFDDERHWQASLSAL